MDDAFVVQINLVMIEKRATACTVDRAAISGIGHIFEISTHACTYLHVPDRSLPAFMDGYIIYYILARDYFSGIERAFVRECTYYYYLIDL